MKPYGNSSPHHHSAVATVFLVLMLALATLSAFDWLLILEPRLRSEAETTARILAQANAENIQHLMSHGTNPPDTSAIRDALSKMLILRDTQTGESYFSAATMEFVPPFELGSFSIGNTACSDCFDNRIPLFDPVDGRLVGLLTIKVSPVFFQAMRDDTRVSFFVWTAALLGMMGLGWWSLMQLQSRSAQSEARAATLFSASPIPLLLVDTVDGAVIDSNAAAQTLFASIASAPARLDDLVGPETRACLESTPADKPLSLETTLRLGNRELPVTTTATTLQLDKRCLLVVAVIDNSAHKAFERRIEEEKEKSESASRAKSAFLAAMSHEIRTPLNGIIGFTHVLAQSTLSEEQREHLDLIDLSARNLLGVIEEILDFSRIEAGKFSVREAVVELPVLLDDTIRLFRAKAEQKGLELLYREEPQLPFAIETDGLRLRQMLGILLDNAIKFTPRGGLQLETETRAGCPESLLILRVSDTGVGIPGNALSKVFEPFYQVDQSSRRAFGGTGLGLVIARNITESLGGTIEVDSSEGKGSCFTVTLPLHIAQQNGATTRGSRQRPPTRRNPNMRALVVDDDPINGKLLVYLLQARDVIADRVESGADALWQVDEQSYDLVFLDVHMPGLSGLDVVRELQQRQGSGPRSYPPLIATTADVQKGSNERLFAEGMDDFLAKPVDVTSLDEILRRWIPAGPAEKP